MDGIDNIGFFIFSKMYLIVMQIFKDRNKEYLNCTTNPLFVPRVLLLKILPTKIGPTPWSLVLLLWPQHGLETLLSSWEKLKLISLSQWGSLAQNKTLKPNIFATDIWLFPLYGTKEGKLLLHVPHPCVGQIHWVIQGQQDVSILGEVSTHVRMHNYPARIFSFSSQLCLYTLRNRPQCF